MRLCDEDDPMRPQDALIGRDSRKIAVCSECVFHTHCVCVVCCQFVRGRRWLSSLVRHSAAQTNRRRSCMNGVVDDDRRTENKRFCVSGCTTEQYSTHKISAWRTRLVWQYTHPIVDVTRRICAQKPAGVCVCYVGWGFFSRL